MGPKRVKQAPKNSFYYFMMDFKTKQGRNFNSLKDVADAAGPHWSRMSKEQRRPYEEKALMEKNNMRPGKYTSDGADVEELERQDKEEQTKIEEMKEYIDRDLKMASSTGRIQDKMFFIIHMNTFCYCTAENRHYPAEIAIAGFNLQDGVLPDYIFQRRIKPGVLPLGYASEANLHSRETHQIAPPLADDTENNMEDVFNDMKEFLQNKMQGSRRMPVLYCHEKYMKMIEMVLDSWCLEYQNNRDMFKVYNLQYMFRVLKNTVAGDNVWPSNTFSDREIEKDVYAYALGICCDYHEVAGTVYCSQSVVVRYAYTICDTCCLDLGIELTPGFHLPDTAFTGACSSRPSSAASSTRSKLSKLRGANSSIRDDDSDSVISFSSKSEWENQSVTSETSSSTANEDEDFPSLGKGKKNQVSSPQSWNRFSPNDSSSVFSQSSVRSYAGATGTSGLSRRPADMPSSIMNSMEKLSTDSGKSLDFLPVGRGKPKSFDDGVNDFPALGRGRSPTGPKGRGFRRPYNGQ